MGAFLWKEACLEVSSNPLLPLRKRAALISLSIGGVMLVIKMSAYFLTHSAAILSDALESVVHVAATAMAMYSVLVSARPADQTHPYGHGKIEFFSAGFEGAMIGLAAVAIIYQAFSEIVVGPELRKLDVGILFTVAASIITLVLGTFLIRTGKQTNSLTLVADGKHVLTDSYTSFGVVGGLGLVLLTGWEILDPLMAIAIALNILASGYKLLRVSIGGLMDEADPQTLEKILSIVLRDRTPAWIDLHHLRAWRAGEIYHVDFHLTIPFYWSVDEAHAFQKKALGKIAQELGPGSQVLIHLDPCIPPVCCTMCQVAPCLERQHEFVSRREWTVVTVTGPEAYLQKSVETAT
jgi:cation diffusion facilitator family transporter